MGVTRNGLLYENTDTSQQIPVGVTHPLPVTLGSDPFTISVATVTIGVAVGINTTTATDPFNTAFSNIEKIENATDFAQSITYADTGTTDQRVTEIKYSSVTASLTVTETYSYAGTAGSYIVSTIGRS